MIPRDRAFHIYLGAIGQGKSYLTRHVSSKWKEDFRRRFPNHRPKPQGKNPPVYICDPNRGFPDGEFVPDGLSKPTALYPWIDDITGKGQGPAASKRVTDDGGLLILDDADMYIRNTNEINPWRCVFGVSRHLRLDVIVSAHRPQGLPKEMFSCASQLWLFAMEESNAIHYLRKMDKFRGMDLVMPREKGVALFVPLRPAGKPSMRRLFHVKDVPDERDRR